MCSLDVHRYFGDLRDYLVIGVGRSKYADDGLHERGDDCPDVHWVGGLGDDVPGHMHSFPGRNQWAWPLDHNIKSVGVACAFMLVVLIGDWSCKLRPDAWKRTLISFGWFYLDWKLEILHYWRCTRRMKLTHFCGFVQWFTTWCREVAAEAFHALWLHPTAKLEVSKTLTSVALANSIVIDRFSAVLKLNFFVLVQICQWWPGKEALGDDHFHVSFLLRDVWAGLGQRGSHVYFWGGMSPECRNPLMVIFKGWSFVLLSGLQYVCFSKASLVERGGRIYFYTLVGRLYVD